MIFKLNKEPKHILFILREFVPSSIAIIPIFIMWNKPNEIDNENTNQVVAIQIVMSLYGFSLPIGYMMIYEENRFNLRNAYKMLMIRSFNVLYSSIILFVAV